MAVSQRSRTPRAKAAPDAPARPATPKAAASKTARRPAAPKAEPAQKAATTARATAHAKTSAPPNDPPRAQTQATGADPFGFAAGLGQAFTEGMGGIGGLSGLFNAPFNAPFGASLGKPEAWSKVWPGLDASILGRLSQPWSSAMSNAAPSLPSSLQDSLKNLQPIGQAVEAMGQSLGATLQSLVGLSIPSDALKEIQQDYLQQATALWNQTLSQPDQVQVNDKRFASPEWSKQPGSAFMAAMYLLNARTLQRLADQLQGDEKARQRVRFAVQQWADAASPSNFLAFNPEALSKAVATKGESLSQGLQHLLNDIRQGHMSQTDESVFEVGVNVATTAGTVVYENPYFQLIEYAPLTSQVHEVPFLFVPPCINKYYILDLQPDNSVVRHLVSKGHRVFMVSWVNADDSLAKSTWDDYVEQGVVKAIDVTREITGTEQINALGFCVGGTLIATALATLAAQGRKPVRSLTLLTTFLDFVNTGTMDVFVDEAMVRMREMTLGPDSPMGGGLLRGNELATTFSFLRANDLVWNYVIGNYLKGEMPPAFDLLYWNSDSTNLPGPMYTWYLRNTYLENKLCKPGAVSVCGVPLDMRRLDMPTFVYGSREDHIVPWDSAYASTQVVSGPTTFVLGASGHIAGVINPPEKKKRSHWVSSARTLPATAQAWMQSAEERAGSWWPVWSDWLASHAGALVAAPKQAGSKRYPAIEAAPGRYVKRKV